MLSINSFSGHSATFYVLVATVAALAVVTSCALVYSALATGGGDAASDTVTVYESDTSGKPVKFIDINGYDGGDAKLIYTLVSDTDSEKSVKITDIEKDPRSTSYVNFPDTVVYDGKSYAVIGNRVTEDESTGLYTDSEGDFKLTYGIGDTYAQILGFSYEGNVAVPVIFPSKITTDDGKSYPVSGVQGYVDFSNAKISDLTILVEIGRPSAYSLVGTFMPGNTYLTSLKFIVNNDNPDGDSAKNAVVVLRAGPFRDCTNLESLILPNVLSRGSYAFLGCSSLGKNATSDNPFVFNTKFPNPMWYLNNNMFSGCTSIKYLELGKNVNKVTTMFAPYTDTDSDKEYSGCSDIKIIYNTCSFSESDIAASILESGSSGVLLYMLSGGEFTNGATITGDTSSGYTVTMPRGTYNGANIPSWTHKDGTVWFDSGSEYSSFKPWGTSDTTWSNYYYAMYGTCTVTYHLYQNKSQISTVTQTVPCMYNTPLYDATTYPDENYRETIKDGIWIRADSVDGDASFALGQSVTLPTNLDLCMILDSDSYKSNVSLTVKWDYVDSSSKVVTTYSYTYDDRTKDEDCKIQLPTLADFISKSGIESAGLKDLVNTRGTASDGRALALGGNYIKAFCDMTITMVTKSDTYQLISYSNSEKSDYRYYLRYTTMDHIVAAPNTFNNEKEPGYHFANWVSSKNSYYPGDTITCEGTTMLEISPDWVSNTNLVSVTYNNYDGSEKSETKTYTYNNTEELQTYTRSGYTLIGWSYTAAGAENGNVNFPLDTPVRMVNNLRLYAVWEQNPPTVIVDNELMSVDEVPDGDYSPGYLFVGKLATGDTVKLTVTFYKDCSKVDKPTTVGVYTMKVGYQIFDSTGEDVTKNYCSDYDGTNPVTKNCYDGILTIYSGNSSTVTV